MSQPVPRGARIPRATFASMVGERIRASVIDGTIKPGTQLNEVDLAAQFGVSRGPVREALQRLIQEGLLRGEPHRGVFVPVMTATDVVDIYLVREALESAAVKRIIGTGRAGAAYKGLDRLVRAMEKAETSDDWDTVARVDLEFHTATVAAAESPRLARMFDTVISETRLCLSALSGAEKGRRDLVGEHRRVAELIREENVEEVLEVLRQHFDDAVVTLGGAPGERSASEAG